MTDIKKMAEEYADNNLEVTSYEYNSDSHEFAKNGFIAGVDAYKKSLLEVGVEGARKVDGYHCYMTDYFTLSSSGSKNKPVEYIELLPVAAKIAKLEEENLALMNQSATRMARVLELEEEADKYYKLHDAAAGEVEILRAENIKFRKIITLLEQSNEFYADPRDVESGKDDEPWRGRVVFGKLARSIKAQVEAIKKASE